MNKTSLQDKQARMQSALKANQQKHKTQIPLNPLNFSPIGIDCRNGKKNLEILGEGSMQTGPRGLN